MSGNKSVPSAVPSERAVLGSVLLDETMLDATGEIVSEDDFFHPPHRSIWQAMLAISGRTEPIHPGSLRAELVSMGKLKAAGGDEYLYELTNEIPSLQHAESNARIVRDKARVRRMIAACTEAAAKGYDDPQDAEAYLDESESRVFEATVERHDGGGLVPVSEIVVERFEEIRDVASRGETIRGLPTGLTALDDMLAGLHPGHLVILAGRPSMGKSALAMRIAEACCTSGHTVSLHSLEMPRREWIDRLLCSVAGVDSNRWRQANVLTHEWASVSQAAGDIHGWPLYVDDTAGATLMQVRARCRRLRARHSLSLVIVDYLQLMRAGVRCDGREQEVATISRGLKALAKELSIPVLALCQLNRGPESRNDKRPTMGDLRESGAIEQDADAVVMLYRDEVYNHDTQDAGVAEVIVTKHRGGPTGTVKTAFVAERMRFEDLDTFHGRGDYGKNAAGGW